MKKIVISAVNITEGGPLSILRDCLADINELTEEYEIYVLVHKKSLIDDISSNFRIIEIGKSKEKWIYRIYYEYYGFKRMFKNVDVYLWISLHDMTPNVLAEKRAVYCHNVTPFYKMPLKEWFLDIKVTLFCLFYKYLYKINIYKNNNIIVQQNWIKDAFVEGFGIEKEKVLVSQPVTENNVYGIKNTEIDKNLYIYPALPRPFKNFEVICEAMKYLNEHEPEHNIKILLTIDGTENKYANKILNKYKDIEGIKFIGIKPRDEIFKLYGQVNGLIFPSKLESWGLPLSEFMETQKRIIAANLPYAKEVLNNYRNVEYFDVNKPVELAKCILNAINNETNISSSIFLDNEKKWKELFEIILKQ